MFNARIARLPLEESTHLRFCHQIVAAAWLDLASKLPEPAPSKTDELIVFSDGREEGSRYPNFMSASERYTYGL